MPKEIALLFCSMFVLYLLWLDREQAPDLSWGVWIPTVWMLSIASKPLAVWRGTGAGDANGSPLDQIFLLAMLGLGLLMLAWRKFNWLAVLRMQTWLVLLICYMLLSVFWSDILFVSFKRWIRELIAVVMAFLLLTERDPRRALQAVFRRTIYILIPFSILLIKYYPEYGVQYGRWSGVQHWIGVTLQKNGLGRLCLFAAFFLVWTFVRRWRGRDVPANPGQTPMEAIVLAITLWLLVGGTVGQYSATAIAALTVGLSLFGALLWLRERGLDPEPGMLTTGIALLILFGTATVFIGGSSLAAFTSALGRDATLTGRTDVWAQLLPVVLQHPVGGSGFGGFWTPRTREFYQISEGHSGYLDVLLDMGFVGLLLISAFLLFSCREAQREMDEDPDWAILWICFLVMTVVHNITETSLNTLTSHLMAVVLFLTVAVPAEGGESSHDEPHEGAGREPPVPALERRSGMTD